MATGTLGTSQTNGLVSINAWTPATPVADVATILALMKNQNAFNAIPPGGFNKSGQVYLPGGRGIIQMQPGDYIGVDHNGWPIVVSSQSIADGSTSWTHS